MSKKLIPLITLIFTLAVLLLFNSTQRGRSAMARSHTASSTLPLGDSYIYMPLIMNPKGSSGGGGNDAGALWLPFEITNGAVLPTYGTSLAVDGNGGVHVAYAIFSGTDEAGFKPATYAYCPEKCADQANWSYTHLGEDVQDARLAIDPNGRPRLILFGPVYDPTWPRMRYQYAACESNCTKQTNWKITTIATPIEATGTREANNNHYFALDSQGRPAFLYTDTIQNDHPGNFYMSCKQNCTDASQWTETPLFAGGTIDKPSLVFSPYGYPRLAFGFFDAEANLYFAYAECDSNCTDPSNWYGTILIDIHGTAMFNLKVDSNGDPRVGFYSGSYASSPFQNYHLYYLWCDSDCTVSGANWFLSDTGMPFGSGDGVDLALDAQNRPRLSFQTAGQGLGYAWCNTNCESGDAIWESQEVESKESLTENYEVLPIHRCTISTWFNGQRTSLALDKAGNPRIGYDAQHWWYGTELVGGVPQTCNYQDVTVTRFALFNQP